MNNNIQVFQQQSTFEAEGEITYVNKDGTLTLRRMDHNGPDGTLHVQNNTGLPIRIGDWIVGVFVPTSSTSYQFADTFPLVKPPVDQHNITRIISFLLGRGREYWSKANSAYSLLEGIARSRTEARREVEGEVSPNNGANSTSARVTPETILTSASYAWHMDHNVGTLRLLHPSLDDGQTKRLLQWWYNNHIIRRLLLLGMTRVEVKSSPYNPLVTYQHLISNPYLLPSLPIEKADVLVKRLGLSHLTSEDRECGMVLRTVFNNQSKKGWSCTPSWFLSKKHPTFISMREKLLNQYGISIDTVPSRSAIPTSTDGSGLVPATSATPASLGDSIEAVYLRTTLRDEMLVYGYVVARLSLEGNDIESPEGKISGGPIFSHELKNEFEESNLDEYQHMALSMAMKGGISIITGGPGSGKTSTLKYLVELYNRYGVPYMLASFTGKAVARIREVIPEAKSPATLDRMCSSSSSFPPFKVLVVDEASMVTTELIARTLRVFGTGFAMVLVGDANQLPPIGWGSLLNQLLLSLVVPCTRLCNNHRVYNVEGEEDGIMANVSAIPSWRDGLPFPFHQTSNCCFIEGDELLVVDIIQHFSSQGYVPSDFKIITPFNAMLDRLNVACQLIWNGRNSKVSIGGRDWYLGDLVMCIENNYDAHIMNGEEGKIVEVGTTSFTVDFGFNRRITINAAGEKKYRRSDWDSEAEESAERHSEMTASDLDLSYALTVHKSQGSEYNFVIFVMPGGSRGSSSFLTRNLIYTGISRAKRGLYHIGDKMKSATAIGQPLPFRHEYLDLRLSKVLPVVCEKQEQVVLSSYNQLPSEYMDDEDPFF